jgi:hypothetical protein
LGAAADVITVSRDVPKQASSGHHRPEPGSDDLTAVIRMTSPPSKGQGGAVAATVAPTITREPAVSDHLLSLAAPEAEQSSLADLAHPVTAYLNSLAPSSRRPQLSALDWIARCATQLYTAETMPWHRLRRPHVLKIRGLLEEHYQPATANRMLSALRGVLRECWQAQLFSVEDYQAATSIPARARGVRAARP